MDRFDRSRAVVEAALRFAAQPSPEALYALNLFCVPAEDVDLAQASADGSGVWWMDGVASPNDCVSPAIEAFHGAASRLETWSGPFVFNGSAQGLALYLLCCAFDVAYDLEPLGTSSQRIVLTLLGHRVPSSLVDFSMRRLSDVEWLRESFVLGVPMPSYRLRRLATAGYPGRRDEPTWAERRRRLEGRAVLAPTRASDSTAVRAARAAAGGYSNVRRAALCFAASALPAAARPPKPVGDAADVIFARLLTPPEDVEFSCAAAAELQLRTREQGLYPPAAALAWAGLFLMKTVCAEDVDERRAAEIVSVAVALRAPPANFDALATAQLQPRRGSMLAALRCLLLARRAEAFTAPQPPELFDAVYDFFGFLCTGFWRAADRTLQGEEAELSELSAPGWPKASEAAATLCRRGLRQLREARGRRRWERPPGSQTYRVVEVASARQDEREGFEDFCRRAIVQLGAFRFDGLVLDERPWALRDALLRAGAVGSLASLQAMLGGDEVERLGLFGAHLGREHLSALGLRWDGHAWFHDSRDFFRGELFVLPELDGGCRADFEATADGLRCVRVERGVAVLRRREAGFDEAERFAALDYLHYYTVVMHLALCHGDLAAAVAEASERFLPTSHPWSPLLAELGRGTREILELADAYLLRSPWCLLKPAAVAMLLRHSRTRAGLLLQRHFLEPLAAADAPGAAPQLRDFVLYDAVVRAFVREVCETTAAPPAAWLAALPWASSDHEAALRAVFLALAAHETFGNELIVNALAPEAGFRASADADAATRDRTRRASFAFTSVAAIAGQHDGPNCLSLVEHLPADYLLLEPVRRFSAALGELVPVVKSRVMAPVRVRCSVSI